jgi:hypothetical protein
MTWWVPITPWVSPAQAGLPGQFAAKALLQTPVALRAVMDACLPGDLTLAQLVTYRPARRGAVCDGRWVMPVFMVIRFTEGGTARTAALRKALAAFREYPNGQVPHPAETPKARVCRSFLRHGYPYFRATARKGRPNGG